MTSPVSLSVVIIWRDAEEGLAEALASLLDQVSSVGGELIVVSDQPAPTQAGASSVFPGLSWVHVGAPLTEPSAWEAGALVARGSKVAFGQARCTYSPGWAEALLHARGGPRDVVTGPVLPAPGLTRSSLAAYLCDYGAFTDPESPEPGRAASNNIAFDRAKLLEWSEGKGLDKTTLLARGGFRVLWSRAMVATMRPSRAFAVELLGRFRRARHFARLRAADWPLRYRMAAGLGCVVLPAVLFCRLVGKASLRRRHGSTLALGFPWVAMSLGLWSLGEMAGYWTGERGQGRPRRSVMPEDER